MSSEGEAYRRLEERLRAEARLRQEAERLLEQERSRLERELAEERSRREQSESLREQSESLREQSESLREQSESLRAGTYYSSIEQVWRVKSESFDNRDLFDALKRENAPDFIIRSANMVEDREDKHVYTWTKQHAMKSVFEVAPVSRTTSTSTTDNSIWPTDIFGQRSLGVPVAHLAHLVPASNTNAALYFDVATWALGLMDGASWEELQKAIHGAKPTSGNNRKVANTGMKHFVSNKIRLAGQAEYLDRNPCVLIIPVMDLATMKGWSGGGYKALVMVGGIDDHPTTLARLCATIGMLEVGATATPAEIETARQLLEQVIRGMAYSLHNRFGGIEDKLDDNQNKKLQELRLYFMNWVGGVKVPEDKKDKSLRVRVVQFFDHSSTAGGHPAPDPLLLAVRAAVNWSRRHHQPLLAAGEPQDEEDELDILAEEQYLEWRNELLRPQNRDDLARGLHQPFGYQGEEAATAK
jgi:hypothetical protein